jgi:hypothetical protein
VGYSDEIKQSDLDRIANFTSAVIIQSAQTDYPDLVSEDQEKASVALGKALQDIAVLYRGSVISTGGGVQRDRKSRTVTKTISTPIFPVSDERGYEIYGSYQYGRGLDILPNNTFGELLRQDASRVFTDDELDLYLLDLFDKNKSIDTAKKALVQRAVGRLLGSNPTDTDVEKISASLGLKDVTDVNGLSAGLANAIANHNDKQIVSNEPITMAQIRPTTGQDAMCDCRGHDDDIVAQFIEADSRFISASNSDELDSVVVQSYRDKILSKERAWKANQDLLRGDAEALPPQPFSLDDVIDTSDVEGVAVKQIDNQAKSLFRSASEDLSQAYSDMKETLTRPRKK